MDTKLSTSDVRKEFPIFDKKGVFWFLGLTFGLTWLIDLAIYLRGGLSSPGWPFSLQLSMLMPAFSVILLGLFFTPPEPHLLQAACRVGTLVPILLPALHADHRHRHLRDRNSGRHCLFHPARPHLAGQRRQPGPTSAGGHGFIR